MIITNSTQLLTALSENRTIAFGENGTLKTLGFFGKVKQWFYEKILPRAAGELFKNHLQMAMARIISDEALSLHGPQNLEYPLPLSNNNLKQAQDILNNSMIEHVACKILSDEPKEVQQGIVKFLQGKARRDGLRDLGDYSLLEAYVAQEISTLKLREGELFGILACGYTRTTPELKDQITFLENRMQTAIEKTWDDKHQKDFSPEGIYHIFVVDAVRDRPFIQGNRIDPKNPDSDFAAKSYKNMLTKELQEPSMVAVAGICMSQTVQADAFRLVSGFECTAPVNPFISPELDMNDYILTGISNSSAGKDAPRVTMTHTDTEIKVNTTLGIRMTVIAGEPNVSQDVGTISYTVVIPKSQFPLPLGSKPDIKVTEMTVVRDKGFTG